MRTRLGRSGAGPAVCAVLVFAVLDCHDAARADTAIVTDVRDLTPGLASTQGYYSLTRLTRSSNGNFYFGAAGATPGSGLKPAILSYSPTTNQYSVLHNFQGAPSDGVSAQAALIQASDGNLWGVSTAGGLNGDGVVYRVSPSGAYSIVHNFAGGSADGMSPSGALIQAADGYLYGTTLSGGANGAGVLYRLDTAGNYAVVYSFAGGALDVSAPQGDLIQLPDGNLYGVGRNGGANGNGAIFKISTSGTAHSLLYSFATADSGPSSLVYASDGNIYGQVQFQTSSNNGYIYRVHPDGTGFTVLHTWTGLAANGSSPVGPLVLASDGKLYGMTIGGGNTGDGTVYSITTAGTFSLLNNSFTTVSNLLYGLVQGADGVLYGVSQNLAPSYEAYGSIFAVTYPVPSISNLSPTNTFQGSSAFTLTVAGTDIETDSVINWNGAPLTSTYISPTHVSAIVPASLLTSVGTASITVSTPAPGGGVSNALSLPVLLTKLQINSISYVRNTDGSLTATVVLKNVEHETAPNAKLTASTLNGTATTTALPISFGNVAVGATVTATLNFPGAAGVAGANGTLAVSETFTGGSWSESKTQVLP